MRINEVFCSLQGEGHFTGTPAVFIRLAGCNLKCPFCDTQHEPFVEMTEEEVVSAAASFAPRHAVITGGEPTLQLSARLVEGLHKAGFFVQMETNGTQPLPEACDIDWITCSPKHRPIRLNRIDELKVVYESVGQDMAQYDAMKAKVYSLQPCDWGERERNKTILNATIDYCLTHPKWRLSLQTHKIINVR